MEVRHGRGGDVALLARDVRRGAGDGGRWTRWSAVARSRRARRRLRADILRRRVWFWLERVWFWLRRVWFWRRRVWFWLGAPLAVPARGRRREGGRERRGGGARRRSAPRRSRRTNATGTAGNAGTKTKTKKNKTKRTKTKTNRRDRRRRCFDPSPRPPSGLSTRDGSCGDGAVAAWRLTPVVAGSEFVPVS